MNNILVTIRSDTILSRFKDVDCNGLYSCSWSSYGFLRRLLLGKVWRYLGGNQKPWIEGQKTQSPNEKVQRTNNDLQYIIQKTKECATRTPLKPRTHTGSPVGWVDPAPLPIGSHLWLLLPPGGTVNINNRHHNIC